MNAGASVFGAGITVVMSGVNTDIDFSAAATIELSAPISGANQGLVLASHRADATVTSRIGGGGSVALNGSVYLPDHSLGFGGNSTSNVASAFAVIVARTLKFFGGMTLQLRADTGATPPADYQFAPSDITRLVR